MATGETGSSELVGRVLAGRYKVTAQLGRGGMGVVCKATDQVLGREVAVKVLRAYSDASVPELAELRTRMQREARAAARIRNGGVITVHDVAEENGRPVIVMELIDGPSLDDVLNERGAMEPREAAAIGAKVMDALDAAHQVGVLHRDVKPGNVLLDRSGRVVLTDFGIASMEAPDDDAATKLTRSGELVGSLDYLPPERAQGEEPGPASDIYSLGMTLYAAVEGASPFRRSSVFSTLTAIVTEPLPEPRRAGPLTPVLLALMAKNPQDRPTAAEARAMLAAVAEGETVRLTPPAQAPVPPPGQAPAAGARDVPFRYPGQQPAPSAAGFRPPSAGNASNASNAGGGGNAASAGSTAPTVPIPAGRRGRMALAAAAVAVVLLGGGGVAYALMGNGGGGGATTGNQGLPGTLPSIDLSSSIGPGVGKSGLTGASASGAASPSAAASSAGATRGAGTGGGTGLIGGGSGGATATVTATAPARGGSGGGSGGGSTPTAAPACTAAGGGKYNCYVWRTANSYDSNGKQVGTLNAGTNYFFCQANLGRRETYGSWTNVWWAKTDDDSGNTGVYISDVYIRGGANDQPIPGLPVC